jgi:hypothetical protein
VPALWSATIEATYQSRINVSQLQMSLDSGANYTGNINVAAFQMARTGGDYLGLPPAPVGFVAFCMEPTENISLGTTRVYDVRDLASAPTSITGGIGVTRASRLEELFGRFKSVIDTNFSQQQAAAFQMAIWEIVTEQNGIYNVTNGTTRFRNSTASGATTLANNMLSALDGTGPRVNNLYAMTFVGGQDLLFQAPEPGGLAVGGLVLLLGISRLRKRTQTP